MPFPLDFAVTVSREYLAFRISGNDVAFAVSATEIGKVKAL